jgi:hypothetical protein
MISVVIPTNRPGGLEHAKASLAAQTFQDFEVLVGSPFDPSFGRWVLDDFKGGFWSLNRIYDRLFAEAKGELIVSLQDFTWIRPDGLARFWGLHERTRGAIAGVGDVYERVGLDGSHGQPSLIDYRRDRLWTSPVPLGSDSLGKDARRLLHPALQEWHWAAMPRDAIVGVGGMDQEMDFIGYSFDNVSAVERMAERGLPFSIDYGNEAYCQRHGRAPGWEKNCMGWDLYKSRKEELQGSGNWPVLATSSRAPSAHRGGPWT